MIQQKFINRVEELKFLNERYNSNKSEFIILYGRRRIGKTKLVVKFLNEKKNGIYFLSSKEGDLENIKNLSLEFSLILKDEYFKMNEKDWNKLFVSLINHSKFKELSRENKFIIIIDEFPYLIHSNRSIPSIFQRIWDLYLKNENVMLILLGSSISIMENEVLAYKSPLYGRRTGQWNLDEISFKHIREFLPKFNFINLLKTNFIIGGVSQYLMEFEDNFSIEKNIEKNILSKGSFLNVDAQLILNEEFKESKNYKLILKSISLGNRKLSNIVNDTGLDKSMVSKYIDVLENIKLVSVEYPAISKKNSKGGLYYICDNYFNFWFRYIHKNKINIERYGSEYVLKNIKKDLEFKYFPFMFEEFILKNIHYFSNEYFDYNKISRQWGKYQKRVEIGDGRLERRTFTYEIDICGINEEKNKILFGECKWQENVDANKILRELKEKSQYVKWKGDIRNETGDVGEGIGDDRIEEFVIFAKSFKGFRDGRFENGDVRLENGENRVVSKEIWEKENNCKLYDLNNLERVFMK